MEDNKKKFPVAPVLLALGAIGAGHLLGYASAGTITRALGNTRAGDHLRRMPPEARKQFLSKLLAGSTAALATAKILRGHAKDRFINKEQAKTASVDVVHYAYQRALELR